MNVLRRVWRWFLAFGAEQSEVEEGVGRFDEFFRRARDEWSLELLGAPALDESSRRVPHE